MSETETGAITPTIDSIVAMHEAEIRRLSDLKATGEIDQLAFLAQASPHATVIAALEREKTRDEVLRWVKLALANPAIVEAIAVGAAHYVGTHGSLRGGQFVPPDRA